MKKFMIIIVLATILLVASNKVVNAQPQVQAPSAETPSACPTTDQEEGWQIVQISEDMYEGVWVEFPFDSPTPITAVCIKGILFLQDGMQGGYEVTGIGTKEVLCKNHGSIAGGRVTLAAYSSPEETKEPGIKGTIVSTIVDTMSVVTDTSSTATVIASPIATEKPSATATTLASQVTTTVTDEVNDGEDSSPVIAGVVLGCIAIGVVLLLYRKNKKV